MTPKPACPTPEQIELSDDEENPEAVPPAVSKKVRRGFSGMDPQKHRAIAGRGGRIAHAIGRAHRFTVEEARSAGQKGGQVVSQDREHMAALGRKGGQARREQLRATENATTADAEAVPSPASTKTLP